MIEFGYSIKKYVKFTWFICIYFYYKSYSFTFAAYVILYIVFVQRIILQSVWPANLLKFTKYFIFSQLIP